jgi:ABC-2 type transport system ATP-binding protein
MADEIPALRVGGVTQRYAEVAAVDGVDLTVMPGEVLGLLGPNGSGKSTLLNLVMGFIRPTIGSVTIAGHDLQDARATALALVGGLVEGSAFYPYLSGRRNLEMLAAMRGLAPSRVDEVLALVQLERASARDFGGYSQGMRQRLGVAASLLHHPRLIVLDEPTSGLDPAGTREMRELLPRLASEGTTVVLASHLLSEVQQVCTRVAIMQAGRIVASGNVDSLLQRGHRWRLRVRPEQLAEARIILGRHPATLGVEQDGADLFVETPAGGEEMNAALTREGIVASEIEPVVPTLEAVFMELTGEDEIR